MTTTRKEWVIVPVQYMYDGKFSHVGLGGRSEKRDTRSPSRRWMDQILDSTGQSPAELREDRDGWR